MPSRSPCARKTRLDGRAEAPPVVAVCTGVSSGRAEVGAYKGEVTSCTSPTDRRSPDAAPRRVVTWDLPGCVGAFVGQPGWSGLAALLDAHRRSDVWEVLLRRALDIPASSQEPR
jgi:hypothetical protein